MKILSITSTYPRFLGDGAGSFIQSISEKLVEFGHELYIIAPDNHQVQYKWQTKVQVDRILYILPRRLAKFGHGESLRADTFLKWYSYIFVVMFGIIAVLKILINPTYRKADVIYAHWLLPGGVIGAILSKLLNIPLVIHLHGSDVYVAERYMIFRPFVEFTLLSASKIIACSENLAHRVIKLGGKNVIVIPYGVDVNVFVPPKERQSSQWKFITGIGRLVNKKGFNYLILAAEKIVKKYPQCKFQIIGDGDQRDELIKLSNILNINDRVEFKGNVSWNLIPIVLANTDIFVLPSVVDKQGNVDGLPNVLLEAMSSGCAIIASNIGGISDVVIDGYNGLLVEPKNVDQLISAIESLLSNEQYRETLGKSARQTVTAKYSWAKIVKMIEDTLYQVVIS
ncbi:MAG: glycosyltransferase [Anaerolineae bacterium]|nr:MAG: glycosyltransferase [Anaerolineae bacterium]